MDPQPRLNQCYSSISTILVWDHRSQETSAALWWGSLCASPGPLSPVPCGGAHSPQADAVLPPCPHSMRSAHGPGVRVDVGMQLNTMTSVLCVPALPFKIDAHSFILIYFFHFNCSTVFCHKNISLFVYSQVTLTWASGPLSPWASSLLPVSA